MSEINLKSGSIIRIAGPVVGATGLEQIRLNDVVYVGQEKLVGEVIRLSGKIVTIQVYEDTSGIKIGEPVFPTGSPLSVVLGPGLLGRVYDGLQRPLEELSAKQGCFLQRGMQGDPLPEEKLWEFTPLIKSGETVTAGDVLGSVEESEKIKHFFLVPPGKQGRIKEIKKGEFTIKQNIAVLETLSGKEIPLQMKQSWPVRKPRPFQEFLGVEKPLITGTRIIDLLFPVAKGGTAIIPGGFGTGKTVTQHSLSRWSDANIVIYIGCGERGNEMADVLEEFPRLRDRLTDTPLMQRTILIANTSNMPVAAREASIYTGITLAEYYRDMGYDVLVLADSTSRWGEALREISGRLEEIPGEEGYPAYLSTRISELYERAGRVICLGSRDKQTRKGSITLIGAVSPPGGDFSEPITQNSMRIAGVFWGLDYDLSRKRHFPAINWLQSYSLYKLDEFFNQSIAEDWATLILQTKNLLRKEDELLKIVQLVGKDALSEMEQEILFFVRLIREDILQQSAFDEIDCYCTPEKSYWMLKLLLDFHNRTVSALEKNIPLEKISRLPVVQEFSRLKTIPVREAVQGIRNLSGKLDTIFMILEENPE